MPPYTNLAFEDFVYMIGVGLILAVAVILARYSRVMSFTLDKRSDEDLDKSLHEFPGGVKEYNRPMPLLIWVVFIGYFIWAAGYVIFAGVIGV